MIDINELRLLVKAATPGPWSVVKHPHAICVKTEAPIKTKYGASRYAAIGGFDRSDPAQLAEAVANARLIAAANPAAITELLDRLEAAEKDVALKERVIDALGSELNAVASERDALRAKIEAMEKQDPVAEIGAGYTLLFNGPGSITEIVKRHGLSIGSKLYALPGAKGE